MPTVAIPSPAMIARLAVRPADPRSEPAAAPARSAPAPAPAPDFGQHTPAPVRVSLMAGGQPSHIDELFDQMLDAKASDLHLKSNAIPHVRVDGRCPPSPAAARSRPSS